MWDLEYLLLFGVPGNKWELLDGQIHWAFPFLDRDVAEAHFATWASTLQRWRGPRQANMHEATTGSGSPRRILAGDGFEMSLYPRPIELRLPLNTKVFQALHSSFWQRGLWPGQDPGKETGSEWDQRHRDVQSNLWKLFGEFCHQYGGHHCGRAVIALNDRCAVEPDQYYYRAALADCTIEGNYFQGVPNLIAEVLSPATRALDRGPRMNVYARAGVPHLWLLDPETDVVEEYLLHGDSYDLTGRHVAGESFEPALFPGTSVSVDVLFETQEKRHKRRWKSLLDDDDEEPPLPPWLVPADQRLGLEALFFFGHPEKRYEIWNNRAPCFLAFGSVEEASLRFGHFLEEICRWEQTPMVKPSAIEPGVELAEVGRFQLARRERQVQLDVAVDGRKFRELLRIWDRHEAWDWGED
jgi:Uma2 family endonuclease